MPTRLALLALAFLLPELPALADDTLIVLNKSEADVSLINPDTGETITRIPVGVGPHEAVCSPDGRTAVVCNYGDQMTAGSSLTVIDVPNRKVLRTIELEHNGQALHRPHGIRFLPDARHVVVTNEQQQHLLVVDIESGDVTATIGTRQRASHMVALSPDASRAYVANIADGTVSVIDLNKNELVTVVRAQPGSEGIAHHPTKSEVWVGNRSAHTVSIIDTNDLEVVEHIEAPMFPIRVEFTPDGHRALVSCAQSGDLKVFNANTRTLIKSIPMTEHAGGGDDRMFTGFGDSPVPIGILVEPDGTRAYVANTNADIITVIDLETLEITGRFETGKQPDGLAWSSTG